jgi:hypothetical protein
VPDGGRDLGHVWSRDTTSETSQTSQTKLAKPNAMMFFHIPLYAAALLLNPMLTDTTSVRPEAYNPADQDRYTGQPLDVGQQLDGQGSPKYNSGFFEGGVLKMLESEEGGPEVKVRPVTFSLEGYSANNLSHQVIGNGHCHVSDNCKRVKGVWMCFGGGG